MEGVKEKSGNLSKIGEYNHNHHPCDPCRSFGEKCSNLVKKQRTKFYILRRCVAMLVCWHERGDP